MLEGVARCRRFAPGMVARMESFLRLFLFPFLREGDQEEGEVLGVVDRGREGVNDEEKKSLLSMCC